MTELSQHPTYQVGGSLSAQSPSYVIRQADEDLYQTLSQGQFSYVLTSRQMGKSSLRVRTMARLESEGYRCVALDLSALGTENVQRSGWYKGLFYDLVKKFGLDKVINRRKWWQERDELSPVQRFYEFFREVVLLNIAEPILIFIDEIDTVLGLPFNVDDFFIFIRSCYNERADNPDLERLGFALFGVATPSDLIQNKQRTPFNIGQAIELNGFSAAECEPLLSGLSSLSSEPSRVLSEILSWTGGQPFLMQKVCALLQQKGDAIPLGQESSRVSAFVQQEIVRDWERHDEPEHFRTLKNRMLSDERSASLLLGLYQRVLLNELVLRGNEEETLLKLTGLVAKRDGHFVVFNRIYEQIFDLEWVQHEFENLRPYGEPFRAWLESDYEDESRLLRGQALLDAVNWASQSKVISPDDYRFLNASRDQEQRLAQLEIEAKERANRLLEETKREIEAKLAQTREEQEQAEAELAGSLSQLEQAKEETQRVRIRGQWAVGTTATIALLIGGGTFFWAGEQAQTANIAKRDAALAQKEKKAAVLNTQKALKAQETATRRLKTVEKNREAAEKIRKEKEQEVKVALDQLRVARIKEDEAIEKVQQANKKAQVAKVSLQQVNQEKDKAIQQTFAVNQQLQKSYRQITESQNTLQQTEQILEIARAGTQIEQEGSIALKLFEANQKVALLKALKVGQKLQKIVKQRVLLEDAVLVDQKLALVQYPSISPLAALQQMLVLHPKVNQWREQSISSNEKAGVHDMSWSPDGQTLAIGKTDGSLIFRKKNGSLITVLDTPQGEIFSVSWSPNGRVLATVGEDGSLMLWSKNYSLIAMRQAHEEPVRGVSWNPDGKSIATVGQDGFLKLWNTDGSLIRTIKTQHGWLYSLSWSPDGKAIATTGSNSDLTIWNKDGSIINSFNTQQGWVNSVHWNPNGKSIATDGKNGLLMLWNTDGSLIKKIKTQQHSDIGISWSPDGRSIATVGNYSLKLWNADGSLITTRRSQYESLSRVHWNPDGKSIATGGGKSLKLWHNDLHITSFDTQQNVDPNQIGSQDMSWNPYNQSLITRGSYSSLKLWTNKGSLITSFGTQKSRIMSMSWSPDGQVLATGEVDGFLKLWTNKGSLIKTIKAHTKFLTSISWSPDGQTLSTVGADGSLKLWTKNGSLVTTRKTQLGEIYRVDWSPNGQSIITLAKGSLILWNIDGSLIKIIKTQQHWVNYVSWSPDGQILATGGGDGSLKLWTSKGSLITSIDPQQGMITGIRWSPDGKIFATGGVDRSVKLWTKNGSSITSIDSRQGSIFGLSWSPNSQIFATAESDSSVKLWLRDGSFITSFDSQQDWITSMNWSPNGQFLTTRGNDTSIKLWPIADLDTLLLKGCDWLDTYLIQTPSELRDLNICQTPQRTLAAAKNLVEDSDQWAENGHIESAIQGYKIAQQWNASINFDPVIRAHQLAQSNGKN